MKFQVKKDLPEGSKMAEFRGRIGSSPMEAGGLMIPLTFEDKPNPFVFYPWEVDALPKEKQ